MKVIEKGTDRTAHAHVLVDGQVQPLEEYGEYVDARDGALCCYVAVEEGHKIKIDGRFSGATLTVAHDFVVDGVCRKANSYTGKSVQVLKHKKLDFDKLLYQTTDGVIDTDVFVSPHSGPVVLDKDAQETIGTIELHVYITRQFGVEHEVDTGCKYDKVKDNRDTVTQVVSYKDVPPQFHLTFEKNCSTLDNAKGNRERRKVYGKRPGSEPWAIFRFHYRSKGKIHVSGRRVTLTIILESILDNKMELSFDPTDKAFAKKEPHALEFEPVPMLLLGSKPAGKNDGDESVRTTSSVPGDAPSTPTNGAKKPQSAQPTVVIKNTKTKTTSKPTTSTLDMALVTDPEPAAVAGLSTPTVSKKSAPGGFQSTSTPVKKDRFMAGATNTTTGEVIVKDPPADAKDSGASVGADPKKSTKKAAKKATASVEEGTEKPSEESIEKRIDDVDIKERTEMKDVVPQTLPERASDVLTFPYPADLPSVFEATVLPSTSTTAKDFIKNGAKSFTSPLKKATAKPAIIDTNTSTVFQKPIIPSTPTTPSKRVPEGTLTPPPDMKRIKTDSVPPLTPTLSRPASCSPGPRLVSIEAQVAEHRKHLEAARNKRAVMVKQKAALEERLAPYKQRMADELERLRQEMAEEEAMLAVDEEDYKASAAMLAEFERAGGEV